MNRFLDERRFYCFAEGEQALVDTGGEAAPAETAAPTPETPPADPKKTLLSAETPPEVFSKEKITLPEGFTIDDERMNAFSEIAKDLPHTKAQELINLYAKQQQAQSEAAAKAWTDVRSKWEDETRADPEIGGEKLDSVLKTIRKVIDDPTLTHPKFREALEYTGMGSNPATIWTLNKWAAALTEGRPASSGGVPSTVNQKGPEAEQKTIAQRFYPHLPSQEQTG